MTLWAACDAAGNCRKVQWDPSASNGGAEISISGSVGSGGVNRSADVRTIQDALNRIDSSDGGADPLLDVDGFFGPLTGKAIRRFQSAQFAGWTPDGRIDPGQKTLRRINNLLGGGKQALSDPENADPSRAVTDPKQIEQAFTLAADALARVQRAIHRLTAVRASYFVPNPMTSSVEQRRLVEWHFKVHLATNPLAQIDDVRSVYERMHSTLTMALRKGSSFRLFQAGNHPDKTAIAYAHWGGYEFALDEKEGGEQGRYIYITPSFRTASSSVIIHELGHYCGGKHGSHREIGHVASPSKWPNGSPRDDSRTGHNYRQLTPLEALCNTYSYQVYVFPEFPEHKVPDDFRP